MSSANSSINIHKVALQTPTSEAVHDEVNLDAILETLVNNKIDAPSSGGGGGVCGDDVVVVVVCVRWWVCVGGEGGVKLFPAEPALSKPGLVDCVQARN